MARDGLQVEELSRMHYPGGTHIKDNGEDYENLAEKTNELLKNRKYSN